MGPNRHNRPPVEDRRNERDLFFWTAQQSLRLILAVAITLYVIVSLLNGETPVIDQLVKVLE